MQDISIRVAVAIHGLAARLREQERGQTAVEYAGILAVIALIFVALFALNLDVTIKRAVKGAVNDIVGGNSAPAYTEAGCRSPSGSGQTSRTP